MFSIKKENFFAILVLSIVFSIPMECSLSVIYDISTNDYSRFGGISWWGFILDILLRMLKVILFGGNLAADDLDLLEWIAARAVINFILFLMPWRRFFMSKNSN